jgi:hypothetical protein
MLSGHFTYKELGVLLLQSYQRVKLTKWLYKLESAVIILTMTVCIELLLCAENYAALSYMLSFSPDNNPMLQFY